MNPGKLHLRMFGELVIIVLLYVTATATASPYFVSTVTFKDATRVERFQYGVHYYMKMADVHNQIKFDVGEYPGHPEYCAWVVRDEHLPLTHVGYNEGRRCKDVKPEWAALHEVCHLRMAHTSEPFEHGFTQKQKESEVTVCMKSYSGRMLE